MPYILVEGCDTTRMMQQVNIKAEVVFRGDIYKQNRDKCERMLKELEADLQNVLGKYFDEYNGVFSETLTNHEYNLQMTFH